MRFSRRLRLATAIILSFASAAVFPQQQRTVVRLKSRDIIIHKEGVSRSFIAELRRTDLPRLHAFVQLRQPADRELAQALRAENLALLFPLTSDVWVAAVEKKFDESDAAVLKFVRWLDEIRPDDKIAPEIDKKRFFDWAVEQDGRLRLMVQFFEDVSDKNAEAILETYTSDFEGMAIQHTWAIRARRDVVKGLSRHDEVKWIDQGPAPFRPLLNFTRRAIHADEVQEFDAAAATYRGVTGLGTQVGVWDEGIDPRHDDFLGRILVPGLAGRHGTAVAGVIGASGVGSAACVASPYLYRGVAPKTELISRTPWRGVSPAIFDIARSIFDNGMDASNHSYVQATNGHYLFIAEQMDRIVRGDERDGVRPIPPRPMVWAAGNNGLFPEYSDVEGYFSVEAPAKNPIVVGANIANTVGSLNHLADFSALGPTWDGRIKPDVVAPGESVVSTQAGTDCYTAGDSGTSISAPAVTGTLALLLEQYASTYEVALDTLPPLPSTLKAALIQTATDLIDTTAGEPVDWRSPDTGADVQYHAGPDYATGYGAIDALAAVSLVKEKKLVEDRVAARTDVHDRELRVPRGTDRIQFTLTWDDEAYSAPMAADTTSRLVNDLELTLIGPDGTEHLAWVLPPLTPAGTIGARDPIVAADIRPAAPGRDHLNNVEQVTVDRPAAGRWVARVSVAPGSAGMLATPQTYSLTGDFYSRFYFTDWAEEPGSVYEIRNGAPRAMFTAASTPDSDHVYHSAFGPGGTLHVSNANGFTVMEVRGDKVVVLYKHETYVRDLAFDPEGKLYFSEASGADADGMIYRLEPAGVAFVARPFYAVRLAEVGGFWAGDFTFNAANVLFLSTGNRIGGQVFKVSMPSSGMAPDPVITIPGEAVTGIAFNAAGDFFFTNWDDVEGRIIRLSLDTGRRDVVYAFPGRRIWDVSFR